MKVEAFNYYGGVLVSMLDEVDYHETFQRLELLELEIRREGPTPARLVAKANLELAIGNYERALNAAQELEAMAEDKVAETEAVRIIAKCNRLLKKAAKHD